jgi:uncharacterized protein (TIGR00255 family)
MLRSMTGQGQSHHDGPYGSFSVEIRAVNNRGFKLVARLGDLLGRFETQVEGVVRGAVARGTVQVNVFWKSRELGSGCRINTDVVAAFFRQLDVLREELGTDSLIDLSRLASLPGAIEDSVREIKDEEFVWFELEQALKASLANFNAMRLTEGQAMESQLRLDLQQLIGLLEKIRERAPLVVESYRDRLRGKVEAYLNREGVQVEVPELLREVQVFADRGDISEEVTRLHSHFNLFDETMAGDQASGRKLDFVIQEMFRETNTIGSKAGDAEIARHVVDMKCGLERMRELVQNIE